MVVALPGKGVGDTSARVAISLDVMYRWRRSIVVVLLIALAAFVFADVIIALR